MRASQLYTFPAKDMKVVQASPLTQHAKGIFVLWNKEGWNCQSHLYKSLFSFYCGAMTHML